MTNLYPTIDFRGIDWQALFGAPDPATGAPTTMDIHYYPTSLATARAAAPSTVRSRWLTSWATCGADGPSPGTS